MKYQRYFRCVPIAEYIVDHSATVREAEKVFGIPKTTIHNEITKVLPHVEPLLALQVKAVLQNNKRERHIRGGNATRKKFQQLKASSKKL